MFTIDADKCVGCWGCIPFCPVEAIYQDTVTAAVKLNLCTDCAECGTVCPTEAISFCEIEAAHDIISQKFPKAQVYTRNEICEKLSYDLVIIGAGPAGLSAAYFAAKAGLSVAIIERSEFIGTPIACAEGISTEGLTRIFQSRENWISTTIEGVVLVAPGGGKIKIDHPDAGYILDRRAMQRDIADMAKFEGAAIYTCMQVLEIIGTDLVHKIVAGRDNYIFEFSAKHYIGADGIGGHSPRWTHPEKRIGDEDFNTCAQVLLRTNDVDEHIPEMYWGNTVAPGGYAWVFPKKEGLANVGLGIVPVLANGKSPQYFLNKFIAERFANRDIVERRDGVVPCGKRLKPLGRGNLLLAGDAGRLTNAISGAGIDAALLSGKLAATTIAEMKNRAYKTILTEYNRRWNKALGKYLDFYSRLRKGIIRLNDNELEDIARFVERNFAGKTWHDMDIPKIALNIAFSQPRLLKTIRHFLPKWAKL